MSMRCIDSFKRKNLKNAINKIFAILYLYLATYLYLFQHLKSGKSFIYHGFHYKLFQNCMLLEV